MPPSKFPQSKVSKYLVAAEGEPPAENNSNQLQSEELLSKLPKYLVPMKVETPAEDDSNQLRSDELAEETFLENPTSPSPKRPRVRWAWILGSILLLIGASSSLRWWQTTRAVNASASTTGSSGKPMAVPVKLATVGTQTIQESSVFVGILQSPRFVTIKPQVEGRIKQLFIKEGDRVQQGQPIVSLQNDDAQAVLQQRIAAQQQANSNLALLQAGTRPEQIAQARATLYQAQARLRDAQAGAQPQEIAQAVAQIDAAKAALDLSKSRALRYAELAKQGAISQDQFEGYRQAQRSNEAALVVAQKKLEQLRKSRSSDISALSATVEQQNQNLKQQQNGARPEEISQAQALVNQATAQVQAAQVQLQYSKVLAPFTGVVGNIPVKIGEYAAKGDTLTTLTQNDSFDLNLAIPLSRSKQIQAGLPVELLDATGKPIAIGKVSFIAPNATADSQTILAKANFMNTSGLLRSGQSVQAKAIWDERSGILIPVTAVSRLGGKTFVFVAETAKQAPDGNSSLVARQQPVELGAIEGNSYQVVKGLKAGEKIITAGFLNLTNGAPVVAVPEETK
jgi:RND family efflux transporter MFP subunit